DRFPLYDDPAAHTRRLRRAGSLLCGAAADRIAEPLPVRFWLPQRAARAARAGLYRFRIFWLGRPGQAVLRLSAPSRHEPGRAAERAICRGDFAHLWWRPQLCATPRLAVSAVRDAMVPDLAERVSAGALGQPGACRGRARLGGGKAAS